MSKLVSVIVLFLMFQISHSQDYENEFLKHCETSDTLQQRQVLEKWYKAKPNDPELYTSYFNYYFGKSKQDVLSEESTPNSELSLQIVIDSLNNEYRYINSRTIYDSHFLNKGFEYIDKGIQKFPERLDMRFGKIYVLGLQENWKAFTEEIIKSVDYSNVIDNKWTWTHNEPAKDAKELYFGSIQSYVAQIYNTQDDSLLPHVKSISEKVLEYYPDNVESLSNLAVVHMINEDYNNALKILFKAETIRPNDHIVLNNIAFCYKSLNNKKKAIEYYKKVVEFGDEYGANYAKEQLEELQKQ